MELTAQEAKQKYGAVNLHTVNRFYENDNVLHLELKDGKILKMPALKQFDDFYFTFGFSSEHRLKFTKIVAADMTEAVEKMRARYGSKWANVYTDEEFTGRAEAFGLTEL